MPPRNPIADSANMPPDARPMSVGCMPPTIPPGLVDMISDAGSGDQDGDHHRPGQHVAEEDQAEDGNLNRLGLGVGDGDDERTLTHGGEHQRGGGDLRAGAIDHPGPENQPRLRQRRVRRNQFADQKDQHERQAEQKAHMGRADGTEACRQLALHCVTQASGQRRQ